ncbi:MAG: hypothetical protein WAZ19_12800 [Anaerolineae bacterium]
MNATESAPQYSTGDADFYLTIDSSSTNRHNEWEYGHPINPTTGAAASPNCYAGTGCWGIDLDGNYDDSSDNRLRTGPYTTTGGDGGLWTRFAYYLDKENSTTLDIAHFGVDCNEDNVFTDVATFTSDQLSWGYTPWYDLETNSGGVAEGCNDGGNVAFAWTMTTNSSVNALGWYIDNVQLEDTSGATEWLNADFEIATAGSCSKLTINEVCYNCNGTETVATNGEWVELYALQALAPGETYYLWDLGDAGNSSPTAQLQEARWTYAFTVHDYMAGGGGIPAGSRIVIYNHLSPGGFGGWDTTSNPFIYYAGSPDNDFDLEDGGDELALYVGNGPSGTKCDIVTWNDDSVASDYRDAIPAGFTWDEACKNGNVGGELDVLNAGNDSTDGDLNISISLDPDASLVSPLARNSSCDWAVSGHNSENDQPQLLATGPQGAARTMREAFTSVLQAPEANPDTVEPTAGPSSPGINNNPTLSAATLSCNVMVPFDSGLPSNWTVFDWQRAGASVDESDGFTWGSGGLATGSNNSCYAGVTAPTGGGGYVCARSSDYLHLDAYEVDLRSNTFVIPANASSACGGTQVTQVCFNVRHVANGTNSRFGLRINSVTDSTSYVLQNWDNANANGTFCYDLPSINGGALLGDTVFVRMYYSDLNGGAPPYVTGGYAAVDNVSVSCFSTPANGCTPLAILLADFSAAQQGNAVQVMWETATEQSNRGFNLFRGTVPDAWDRQLNATLIPSQAQGSPSGFFYTWEDGADLVSNQTYYYWLQDVDVNGIATLHGPVSVTYTAPTAVTLDDVQAQPSNAVLPLTAVFAAALAAFAAAFWTLQRKRV